MNDEVVVSILLRFEWQIVMFCFDLSFMCVYDHLILELFWSYFVVYYTVVCMFINFVLGVIYSRVL